MKSIALLAFLAATTMAASVKTTLNTEYSFTAWKAQFGKTYLGATEEAQREAIFNKNLAYINKHNAAGLSYTLGMNQFGDLVS